VHYLALSKKGPTGGVEPEQWSVRFRPLLEPTEAELVEIRKQQSETDKAYFEMQVL